MNITTLRKAPYHNPKILDTLVIDVSDATLQKALKDKPSLEEKQDYVEDMAEIGAKVTEHQSKDSEKVDILKMLEHQRQQDQVQHERQMREMRESHRAQMEEAEKQRQLERKESRAQMDRLNSTVDQLSSELINKAQKGQSAIMDLQEMATDLMSEVGEDLRAALRERNTDQDALAKIIESTLEKATEGVKEHVDNASVLLQSHQDREEARLKAEEMKEKTSSHKGLVFEERLFRELSDFADHRGDQVEHTGASSEGGSNSKKGDLLYTLQTARGPVKIAIEAKDKRLTQSGKEPFFLPDLRTAKLERKAKYGIVAASLDANSDADGRPRFMPLKSLGDDNYAVIIDEEQATPIALLSAIQMIASFEANQNQDAGKSEKTAEIQRRLQKITEATSNLRSMKASATRLQENLKSLQETLQAFDYELKREVRGLEKLVGKAY